MSNFVMSSKVLEGSPVNVDAAVSFYRMDKQGSFPDRIYFDFDMENSSCWTYRNKEDRDSDYDYLVRNYVTVIPDQSSELVEDDQLNYVEYANSVNINHT